jgi:YidC/Oxa1 family membrane protein insertase
LLRSEVRVSGVSDEISGLNTYLSEHVQTPKGGGIEAMFVPKMDHQEFYTVHDGDTDRVMIAPDEETRESYAKVGLSSIGSQYFVTALLDRSQVMPDVNSFVDTATQTAFSVFSYKILNRNSDFVLSYEAFAGPKSLKLLESIDDRMSGILNLGWFHSIGELILRLLKMFYKVLGNWGFSIIALTLLVRTILLPLHIMSFRSMKGMQKIQPMMKEIREKHKDDPARANQEVMALMKEQKVNPMGGCIPTLLQFPVFIALYQVLGQSIELYHAPFILWIQDLSAKDPYYVLPVLMGATMFLQMKTTPTTMEPAQQKIMMIMPLVFTFFMAALPSGLTLYMFVSALFSVVQQLYFLKDKKSVAATAAA